MSRFPIRFSAIAILLLGGIAACSHEQKVAQAAPSKVAPAAPGLLLPRKAAVPAAVVSESSKNKEGDAIFFDFDSAILRDEARPVLQQVAESVRQHDKSIEVEGNCDELGTVEYNLALGEQRARAAKDYLVHMGVSTDRITTVSYGSQRPKYPGHDDSARAKNRRDDLVVR